MAAPFADGTPPLVDAWEAAYPGRRYPPTFRIYEKERPGDPELHCDFIFVSDGLRPPLRGRRASTREDAGLRPPAVILTLRCRPSRRSRRLGARRAQGGYNVDGCARSPRPAAALPVP